MRYRPAACRLVRRADVLRVLRRGALLSLVALWPALSVLAQTTGTPADLLPPKFLPPSPTASALPRFDAQQLVNLPTGASQLSVAVGEVHSGPLQLPVSLAYSYTGLQVSQPRDLVGVGWALQAGASITRQINGLLDDAVAGDAARRYDPAALQTGADEQAYLKRAFRNELDTGPDLYSFSLPDGTSGRFLFLDTTLVLVPRQPVHIRRLGARSPLGFAGFQITTEDGTRYQFQTAETTTPNRNNFGTLGPHYSAWHLTQLIAAGNTDTLRLHYTDSNEQQPQQCAVTTGRYFTGSYQNEGNVSDGGAACGSAADYSFHNVQLIPAFVRAQYLDSITARGAHLVFARAPQSHELRCVRVLATTGGRREVKRLRLYQSRFGGATAADYRLRLDSLQESANGTALPPYRFRYREDDELPTRGSAAQDYWGYANGASANGDFATQDRPSLLADPHLLKAGRQPASREPDYAWAALGALQQVRYPTGGSTTWDYEPGRLYSEEIELPWVADVEILGPIEFSPGSAHPINGGRLPVTVSGFLPFEVKQSGSAIVALSRPPSVDNNRLQDFDIWRRLPTGDSLITGQNPGSYRALASEDGKDFAFYLEAGQYVAKLYCEENDALLTLTVHLPPYRDSTFLKLGIPGPGVRVWRTTTTAAGAPPLVRTYRYTTGNGFSSGRSLLPQAGMGFEAYEFKNTVLANNSTALTQTTCQVMATSSDNRGLGDEFNKYNFYYRCVTEETGPAHGARAHYFTHLPQQFNDVVPTNELVYRHDPQRPQARLLVQETGTAYATDSLGVYPLLRVREAVQYTGVGNVPLPATEYGGRVYEISAGFVAPVLSQQSLYDAQGRAQTTLTRSTYRQQRLVRTATRTSSGWAIQRYKRLGDYAATPAVTALRTGHFNPVVETQTWRRPLTGPDSSLVGGQVTFYAASRQPAGAWALRLLRPAPGPDAEQLSGGAYAGFKSDTRYRPVDSVRYDPVTGRVQERQAPHGPCTAYVWGYDRSLVVAQVQNATFAQVRAALGQAALDRLQGPRPGTDADVRQALAPLRTQLPQARVTSFTHRPLVGVTSQTDPSGRTVYYEYDALGRLLRVRDEQGRLLTEQEYRYAQQP